MARRKPFAERMVAAVGQGDKRYRTELRSWCAALGGGIGLALGYLWGGVWAAVAGGVALGIASAFALPVLLQLGLFALGWGAILGAVALVAALVWWAWRAWM